MTPGTPKTIHLRDYAPAPYKLTHVHLDVRLDPADTRVFSRLRLTARVPGRPLVLHGEGLKLISVAVDGQTCLPAEYALSEETLTLHRPPDDAFEISIEQACSPASNTLLSGLYQSNGMYCTQMEAEGFRRFAFALDRPDEMAIYRVRIEAPVSFPVLLSNGNLVELGVIDDAARHFAIWEDPHPKPTYLFALVAGDLASVHDVFTTCSGRVVKLGVHVEKGNEDRCGWAMESLKTSMRWDETRFGREYDLDVFNIVAVSDFNMGAMENKGLNIFNDKYILALPDTATDTDYQNIEAIIAHEYFHNWTGNRITCRDWFQLCLKEGLTVYRDQEFTSDLRSRAVKRIQDVKTLRGRQFPEDQGPLAHAVRPTSYIEINNFYTPTVYEKGAELCRMMHTLTGPTAFRAGMDIYFQRHDGDAATIEDFIACMAEASGRGLSHFSLWYEQAGTPVLHISTSHDAQLNTFTVTIEQQTPPTPGQTEKRALHIPLGFGLVDETGVDIPLNQNIIELTETRQQFTFHGIKSRPVLSLNRGFTAPVAVHTDASQRDLIFLMGHDSDSFNRWDSAQTLARALVIKTVRDGKVPSAADNYGLALGRILDDSTLDDAFKAQMLALPPDAEIAASLGGDCDSDVVVASRDALRSRIATINMNALVAAYERTGETGPFRPDTVGAARRALRYGALGLIAAGNPLLALELAGRELATPHSMTAELGALSALLPIDDPQRDTLIAAFHHKHRGNHLLIDKWLLLNAQIPGANAYQRIETLLQHSDFKLATPNKVYALVGGFSGSNLSGFNAAHGEGYRVVADTVIALDRINPQAAARIAVGFRSWKLFDEVRRTGAMTHMERILAKENLSKDVFEIISRTLRG